jgi:hypothetical protein
MKKGLSIGIIIGLLLIGVVAMGTPLTKDRNTPSRAGLQFSLGVGAGENIHGGALVMRNAAGYVSAGTATTGGVGLGRADEAVDNSSGGNGDVDVKIGRGIFRFANSADADAITSADIGNVCYIVDDATVAKTNNGGTRSPAGRIYDVDSAGVWVEFLHMSAPDTVGTADLSTSAVTTVKIASGAVIKSKVSYKSVAVLVTNGTPTGASAADPDLVGGEILGVYPTSNQDQLIDSVVLGGDGAIAVTLATNATATNFFKVVVLRAL